MGKSLETVPYPNLVLPEPPPKNYKFTCDHQDCGKQFVKLSRLKVHQRVHNNEKSYKCSFEGCDSSYFRPNHLKRHVATRHSQAGGDYVCGFEGCKASFDSSLSLYFHEKRKHNVKKYKCSHCQEMFSKKFQMKEHESEIHTGEKPFKCLRKDCGETFDTHANLKSHQRYHRKESLLLNGSVSDPNPKSHKCTRCDEVFDKWTDMVSHRKTHPPLDSLKVPCPVCQKIFTKSSLRVHKKVHDGNESTAFFCPHEDCPRYYYHVKNLTHHVRHAHEGQSYECTICSKKLCSKQKLANHIKTIHENPKPPKQSKKLGGSTFNRKKFLEMLCGDKDSSFKRRGPAKGSKPKKREWPELAEATMMDTETNEETGDATKPETDKSSIVNEEIVMETPVLENGAS